MSRRTNSSCLAAQIFCVVALAIFIHDSRVHASDSESLDKVQPFLRTYCTRCHGDDEQFAERRFDQLATVIRDDDTLLDYQDILDQLNLGEMPPADEEQPDTDHRAQVIERITHAIKEYHDRAGDQSSKEVVMRRLNAREYRNTIRDLFGFNMDMFDPTREFPRDQSLEHLENVGDVLVTSGYLLSKYLDAAGIVVDKALYPLEMPEVNSWKFHDGLHQQPEIDQVHKRSTQFKHLTLYDSPGADKPEGAYAPIHAFAQGVPHDGFYEIQFRAGAFHRDHQYDDSFFGTDRREPFRLGIVAGHQDVGPLHVPQPVQPLLADCDLSDEMESYSVRVWMDQGYTPRFIFRNGLMDVRNVWSKIHKRYPDFLPQKGKGIVFFRRNAITNGKIPHIQIDDIHISGPYYDDWPTQGQKMLLGENCERILKTQHIPREDVMVLLSSFMQHAFRREVDRAEVEKFMELFDQRLGMGRNSLEAYADTSKAVLCSPNFLFWNEGSRSQLADFAVANRLASFLWASKPDTQLLSSSLDGQSEIARQCQRMLSDARRSGFVKGFLSSWLTLSDLGSTPPDRSDFRDFYHYDLDSAMRKETRLFFEYLLDENLSIFNFLDSDFTFVNKRLALHYDLKVPDELQTDPFRFQRVELEEQQRGGLLGQASVLTVTANGIDTSPVVRGVWLLENLLGTPPSPPATRCGTA